ncbi:MULTISPECIES: ABC transporter permease [Dyella]|uniref:ABC transporter permease n=2 Tax=Dyella TaxID=231454 RepID=A0A4R0Z142_9GAMM|nr:MULTISPECIES: ABC transporter permease [Dyella]TBR39541.1 ABC transporter permease [Dyella terrae]TCI12876.1 ABC transporter permease [Dyella soli]
MSARDGFRGVWRTLRHHASAALILLGATILYSFYYPLAYRHQVASELPIAIVDGDHSALSRALIRKVRAVDGVQVVDELSDVYAAQHALARSDIDGYLYIPKDYERDVRRGEAGELGLYSNGAYLIRNQTVLESLAKAVTSAGLDIVGGKLLAAGIAGPRMAQVAQPLTAIERPMFNKREGYGSYVVPAVAQLIVQQTLWFGAAMLIAVRRSQGGFTSGGELLGWVLFFLLVGTINGLYFNGLNFWIQDYPRGGNLPGLLVAMPLFIASIVALALFTGSFFMREARVLQSLSVTSVPIFFLSGISWPLDAMPTAMGWLGKLAPSTPGIQAMVKLNQMGASLRDIAPELGQMALLVVLYGGLGAWRLLALSPRPHASTTTVLTDP